MGPAQSQRGLADARRPPDRRDHHGACRACRLVHQRVQRAELGNPAGEMPRPGWQLPWYYPSLLAPTRRYGDGVRPVGRLADQEPGVASQNAPMHFRKLGRRFHAKLIP